MSEIDYRTVRRRVLLRWLNRILFAVSLLFFLSFALMPRYLQDPRDDGTAADMVPRARRSWRAYA